jgi:starch synthase
MGQFEVWHVAREFGGIAEAGGVKDAVRGLAMALVRADIRTVVVLPFYGFQEGKFPRDNVIASFTLPIPDHDKGYVIREEPVRVFSMDREGVHLLLVDSPRFGEKRDVYTFTAEDEAENPYKKKGTGHWDVHQMNLILQKAALESALRTGAKERIFHCHDGHTAILPALMREDQRLSPCFRGSGAVVTIHNAGIGYHQEIWDFELARLLTGFDEGVLRRGLLNATVDPLLLASLYAPLATVSPRYAEELLAERESELSGGLGRTLRERHIALTGITNGIDPELYDPRFPEQSGLPFRFDPALGDWMGKRECREMLFKRLSIQPREAGLPLFSFIGRLTPQKGIDVFFDLLSTLLPEPDCPLFAVLGQGEREAEARFEKLAAEKGRAGRLVFIPLFDPPLAKLLFAASDFLLIPSAYEPCGLTDYYAQLMGTIPVVHRVGGLVKVRDGVTGFSYETQSTSALIEVVRKCSRLHRVDPALLERIRKKAFEEIFTEHSWDKAARDGYIPLYESALRSIGQEESWRGS